MAPTAVFFQYMTSITPSARENAVAETTPDPVTSPAMPTLTLLTTKVAESAAEAVLTERNDANNTPDGATPRRVNRFRNRLRARSSRPRNVVRLQPSCCAPSLWVLPSRQQSKT